MRWCFHVCSWHLVASVIALDAKVQCRLDLLRFMACSVWASFATSTATLIIARGAMGIGAAAVFPATLAILIDVFRDPIERAKAIGVWSAVSGMAVAFGPISGGFLLEHFYWGSVFLVNVPIVIVALVLGAVFIPTSKDPNPHGLDFPGLGLSIAMVGLLVYTVIEGPHRGWTSVETFIVRWHVGIARSIYQARTLNE
jgi:MFS family permease